MGLSEQRGGPSSDFGRLERTGDVSVLHYRRRLPHPRPKVWRALSEDGHLAAWFPTTVEGDRAPGAALRFTFRESEGEPFDQVAHRSLRIDQEIEDAATILLGEHREDRVHTANML